MALAQLAKHRSIVVGRSGINTLARGSRAPTVLIAPHALGQATDMGMHSQLQYDGVSVYVRRRTCDM